MYHFSLSLTTILVGATVALVQPFAMAKSKSEVADIAKAVTVEIKLKSNPQAVGSGIIIGREASLDGNRKGDLYTIVTNRHVICGSTTCDSDQIANGEVYSLSLVNGSNDSPPKQYQVTLSNIKFLGDNSDILDLAIIQFRSNRNYAVAKVATPGSLKIGNDVYTAGFPFAQRGLNFGRGKAIAVVNKRLTGDSGGYTIIYNAPTLPGMSGGGVFNENGQLVAIHGIGDRYKENTDTENKSRIGNKIGFNRGIPIHWLIQSLGALGIKPTGSSVTIGRLDTRSQAPASADEHFITGFNKYADPGDNVLAGKRQAIQEFSKGIRLNSKYEPAYFMRAITYEQVKEVQLALTDYNQSILLNPTNPSAYHNRALLKQTNLNDVQGALADYNQTILLDSNNAAAYNNRAFLKVNQLNDVQGALADYNQAISLNPKSSELYVNRAILKQVNLTNIQGALADYDKAISLNPNNFEAYNNRGVLAENLQRDAKKALADYNQAIIINPQYAEAYYNRASLKKNSLYDLPGALSDYNQAIIVNPKYDKAYYNRAILKNDMDDIKGAVADYSQAIVMNPKYAKAYCNRGILKYYKLNDIQGGLADFDQAILLDPKYAEAYYNRALLKKKKLNDHPGAIQDFRQAARLFREQGRTQNSQLAIKNLQLLGAIE
jgi:tetratricopeptide (TPR) repeat protein/S1-C subfamily serine protease